MNSAMVVLALFAHVEAKSAGASRNTECRRNVVIEQSFSAPKITKDGVTVAAKHIELADKHQNIGAQPVRQVRRNPEPQALSRSRTRP